MQEYNNFNSIRVPTLKQICLFLFYLEKLEALNLKIQKKLFQSKSSITM